jgi:hypothetical protein
MNPETPAFPIIVPNATGKIELGMNLRTYIATAIAAGDAAQGEDGWSVKSTDDGIKLRCGLYVRIADALISELKKEPVANLSPQTP